jgi:hypothetical protein
MTVREGWVVFSHGVEITAAWPAEEIAWRASGLDKMNKEDRKLYGFDCRRVRVTIETIEELEQGQSDG